MPLRRTVPILAATLVLGLTACGSSEPGSEPKQSDAPSGTVSTGPTSPATVPSAAGTGTFTSGSIPCGKLTPPAPLKVDRGMTTGKVCAFGAPTQSVLISFRTSGAASLEPLIKEYGAVEVDGWTSGVEYSSDDGSTHFMRLLVSSDDKVFQCSVSAGPKGPAVVQATFAGLCDAAKSLVYRE